MRRKFLNISGFVLAGGASRRMGRPKATLLLAGETMLARQIRLLREVSRWVAVVGRPPGNTNLEEPICPDVVPGRGPLGGLYTALGITRTEFNLLLSCDLPLMEGHFLDYLCRSALESRADVTVPESYEHGYHPLCAVYRRRALWAVRASLEAGENKVASFFTRVRCHVVSVREMARAGFSSRIFDNMNTPEDYAAVLQRLKCEG